MLHPQTQKHPENPVVLRDLPGAPDSSELFRHLVGLVAQRRVSNEPGCRCGHPCFMDFIWFHMISWCFNEIQLSCKANDQSSM